MPSCLADHSPASVSIETLSEIPQGVGSSRPRAGKKWRHHRGVYFVNRSGSPLWLVVFVDRQGANAFHGFTASALPVQMPRDKAVPHHIALHAKLIG